MIRKRIYRSLLAGALPIAATAAFAQEPDATKTAEETASSSSDVVELAPMHVIGSKENIEFLPGSAAYIDTADIRTHSYDDINRMLQQVPGVYFREEDGYGIFANLSLRGVNSNRSSKVTIMEDGVLTSPAPYSAPAAYYTPTAGRMHGIEILKGSSQIMYGPETTGGVINYLSTPIPQGRTGYIKGVYGSDDDVRLHAYYGDAVNTGLGRVDFLFENYHRTTSGFKEIDERPGFTAGNDTGFTKNEPMFKIGWEPNTANYQRIEFKIGYTDLDFNETYLGLTDDDFDADPYRRYAATRFDNIVAEQTRTYLRHIVEPTPDLRLTTTVYYNQFDRNWAKVDGVSADGITYTNPALAIGAGGPELDILRGDSAGFFRVGANKRGYASYGIENRTEYTFEAGSVDHAINAGIRLHEDYARRYHSATAYEQNGQGAVTGSTDAGRRDRRKEETRALALFVQDRVDFGRWAVTPGVRYEHLRFKLHNPGTPIETENLDTFAPGISVSYDHTDNLTFFSGLHRGISMPGPSARVSNGVKEETTLSYEVGSRYNNRRGFRGELIFFYTDFDDLLVSDSVAGGSFNGNVGEATSYGIEAVIGYDPGIANNWGFNNPNTLTFTITEATLDSDSTSTNPESIFSGGEKGDRLPYIPRYSISAGTGLEFERWAFYIDASFIPETYASANNDSDPVNPTNGQPDPRFGKIDDRFLVDIAVHYKMTENARVIGGIHNLLDEEYMVSRLPYGPRPGQPLTAHVGLEVVF